MKHLSGNGKQRVIADGNPYLRVYCILASPVERLMFRCCLIHLKKHSTLPTFL